MTSKERFLRYITFSTASSEESETSPSTVRQLDLGRALKAEMEKRGERDARMFARLDELGRVQAAQGAKLDHIAETCAETRQIALDNSIVRRPGGRRNYDPPEEP